MRNKTEWMELRRSVRRLRWANGGLWCVLLLMAVPSAMEPEAGLDVVRATRFEVLNEEGKVSAVLGHDPRRGGLLQVHSRAGEPVAEVGVAANGTGMVTVLSKKKVVAMLSADDGGNGTLEIRTKEAKATAVLGVGSDSGVGALALVGHDGQELVEAGMREGGGFLSTHHASAKSAVELLAVEGGGLVSTVGGGAILAQLGVAGNGHGRVLVKSSAGSGAAQVVVDDEGDGAVVTKDRSGRRRVISD